MNFLIKYRAERSEGINVSKDLIADEVMQFLVDAEIDEDKGIIHVDDAGYEGSSRGKPMRFTIDTSVVLTDDQTEFTDEELVEALDGLLDGESIDVEDSTYDLEFVSVERVPDDEAIPGENSQEVKIATPEWTPKW